MEQFAGWQRQKEAEGGKERGQGSEGVTESINTVGYAQKGQDWIGLDWTGCETETATDLSMACPWPLGVPVPCGGAERWMGMGRSREVGVGGYE